MNEVKIIGKFCQKKEYYMQDGTCVTRFSLNFRNGKRGENDIYDFLSCKYLGKLDIENKCIVEVTGWLAVENWEHDGKKYSKVVIKSKQGGVVIYTPKGKEETQKVDIFPDKDVEPYEDLPLDDDIPF